MGLVYGLNEQLTVIFIGILNFINKYSSQNMKLSNMCKYTYVAISFKGHSIFSLVLDKNLAQFETQLCKQLIR